MKSIFEIPISGKQTQKEISLNTVWKYTITEITNQIASTSKLINNTFPSAAILRPIKSISFIFHPPIV
ncbi:MAG: hypothetical protein EAZ13_05770 [Sphingobacteriia bacterium]|nr:MAG: hypothetical protein EAZ35_09995 [Sphingobacteriia bacterium]TAH07586.1 MAG: hypothetical protein EAZ13_05770 [Sphingobacteriia bacterium]